MTCRKKICFVAAHPSMALGGSEIHSLRLARLLQARGYDVCFLQAESAHFNGLMRERTIDGISVFGYRRSRVLPIVDLVSLRTAVRHIGADVYYMRGSGGLGEALVNMLELGRRRRGTCKTIWQCPSGRSLIPFQATLEILKSAKRTPRSLMGLLERLIADLARRYAIQNSDAIIVQTEDNRSILRQIFGRRSHVVYKGIETQKFKARDKPLGVFTILFLRNIRPISRIELFIELARAFNSVERVKFQVIGRYLMLDNALIHQMCEAGIEYLGQLPNAQVQDVLKDTHLLVDCLYEPRGYTVFGNAFIEAWAHGVPVISFGSNPDSVFDRYQVGCFARTIDEAVDFIRDLSVDRARYEQFSRSAFEYVRRRHDMGAEVTATTKIIEETRDDASS